MESASHVLKDEEAEVKTKWGNQTLITEFVLLGFGDSQQLQIPLFLVFLVIYIFTMAGNILIIALVVTDRQLHMPMYFFLGNLSCLETCYTSTILPKILASFMTGVRTISVWGCTAQFYVFASLAGVECCLLATMSYDRYLAICKPLHYATIMKERLCFSLAVGSWINGFLAMSVMLYLMSRLSFCGPNEIEHFFCDLMPVIRISCSETQRMELVAVIFSSLFTLPPFLLTLTSYVFIISTILRIPSTTGRKKAFSTCSSHLIVVTIFYGTLIIVYVLPKNKTLIALNKVFSVFYTVLTPLVNPLIYSLRNKEVRGALKRLVQKCSYCFTRMETRVVFSQ
ncbi:olfactory receptor 6F1-like [Hemicordylus capensis]|uniref:olfactory receptor 6F1-like n=1 Tax=Hemicordylus capensis TaxID=884348 RepID=UPI0023024F37|nr:olfactory receptor 6F1-like [Hemicordylus capensis]